jgi:hypothetical protein
MTLTLHLGVIDQPYVNDVKHTKPPARKPKRGGKSKGSMWRREDLIGGDPISTTGDVAQLLEEKYHVMEHFVQAHEADIAKALGDSMLVATENMLSGAPPSDNPFAAGEAAIGFLFKETFLQGKEMDRLGFPGIPTKAALAGVNPRLAHPFSKSNPARPSFVRSGLYQASFVAWVEAK